MKCPKCGEDRDRVVDSRPAEGGAEIRRRRECLACGYRYTTYERYDQKVLYVKKKNGEREPFDRAKLKLNLLKACHKRRSSEDTAIDDLIDVVENKARALNTDDQIESYKIGELVLDELKKLDHVAYVRFASVYKDFDSIDSFVAVLSSLKEFEVDEDSFDESQGKS